MNRMDKTTILTELKYHLRMGHLSNTEMQEVFAMIIDKLDRRGVNPIKEFCDELRDQSLKRFEDYKARMGTAQPVTITTPPPRTLGAVFEEAHHKMERGCWG